MKRGLKSNSAVDKYRNFSTRNRRIFEKLFRNAAFDLPVESKMPFYSRRKLLENSRNIWIYADFLINTPALRTTGSRDRLFNGGVLFLEE